MAVQFVLGRAGSGKTMGGFDAIAEAMRAEPLGPPIYWILPKQATFQAERLLTCSLGAFSRGRVLSFEMLGQEVLSECGGMAVPQITALGRQMILGHLLRRHQDELQYFRSAARQVGLAAKLDATFAELEQAGKSADDLAALIAELQDNSKDVEGQALLAKLGDLHRIYSAYCAYLGRDRLDPHRRLEQVLGCIEQASVLRGATMYVDGFVEFTEFERRMLASAAKVCHHLQITLLLDPDCPVLSNPHLLPDEMALFHRTQETYRRLWFTFGEAGVAVGEPVLLRETPRFAAASLKTLEKLMFDRDRVIATPLTAGLAVDGSGGIPIDPTAASDAAIELIEAPDRRGEVDAAARRIRALLHEGLRLRDIAVLVRDLDLYGEILQASFGEHGLAFFVDRRRTAAHHPLLQFIRGVFLIALQHWPHEPMMTLLKSGLSGLSLEEADELENYVLLHRLRGSAWAMSGPWTAARVLTRPTLDEEESAPPPVEAPRIDELRRRAVTPLLPFIVALGQGRLSVRQMVVELFALLERFKVRQTLTQWMAEAEAAQEHEQRGEHEQVWSEIIELFDQMVELLGEEQTTVAEFLEILDSGLEQFDLALTPPTVDQVLVGQIDRTITPRLRAAVLLGLNEGVFPHAPREDSVLSDRERRTLHRHQVKVNPDTQRRLLDENFLGYLAFTRAAERLIVTRSLADDAGKPLAASPFWQRLRQLFPQVPVQTIPREFHPAPQRIGTPRQLVTALMRWVRADPDAEAGGKGEAEMGAWPALYQWLATHECCHDSIDLMRYRAWKALSYDNLATLSPEMAERLFPAPLEAGVSQIETFATCPFKHFLQYGLNLRPREQQEVTQQDLSRVYHDILQRLVRQMLQKRQDWGEMAPEASQELIRQYAQEIGQTLKSELMLSSARNQYLLQYIEKTLAQVVAHQRALRQRGRFQPAYADLSFGHDAALPPLAVSTPRGREVHLHGKIDRVDVLADEGRAAIIDYKLTGSPLSLDRVYHGLSLQLLTYLLVLQANGEQLLGKPLTPVAAFYVGLLRRLEEVRHPEEAIGPDDPRFDLRLKPRGLFTADCVPDLDNQLETGFSDVVNVCVNKDGRLGRISSSDVAEADDFAALLTLVQRRLGELGDQILSGDITIAPYRINRLTPCPHCDYRAVCRFDAAINGYHHLTPMKREDVLAQIAGGTHGR